MICPIKLLTWHPVSTWVNSSRNKESQCKKPITLEYVLCCVITAELIGPLLFLLVVNVLNIIYVEEFYLLGYNTCHLLSCWFLAWHIIQP
jgi:hypothetical protein